MPGRLIESYLADLASELRMRGMRTARIVEETRAHLEDIVGGHVRRGLSNEEAEREATAQFGSARAVAARFAAQHFGWESAAALVAALALGFAISWMDNRPHWDDTGVTAMALLLAGGAIGALVPRRPWLWAIAIWIWLPAWNIATLGVVRPAMLAWLIVLFFPMSGALIGTRVRRFVVR